MPKRIQRKRTKGWRMPAGAVYVGRSSKWGNPFTGPDAVEKYREMIKTVGYTNGGYTIWVKPDGKKISLDSLKELRGKDLVCWCPLDKPCHADILLEIVNK